MPGLLIDTSVNVATPLVALSETVPESVPPPGFVPIARLINALLDVTVFPPASWTVTVTAGLIALPATTVVGCWLYTTFVAGPAVTANEALTAPVRPVAVAVNV